VIWLLTKWEPDSKKDASFPRERESIISVKSFVLLCIVLFSSLGAANAAPKQSLTLFAAASMTDVMDALTAQYAKTQGIAVTPVYAGSSALARQIEYGAPADLFVSANVAWMDDLQKRGLIISGSRADLVSNALILAMADPCPASLDLADRTSILSALKDKRLALGEPTAVPAGIYAAQALTSLGIYNALMPHMVFSENVRMALSWVVRGEADAGIVYASDLHAVSGVTACASFPQESHDLILYPIARIKTRNDSAIADTANSFLAYILSPEAAVVLTRFGFTPLDRP